ncbi:S1/P1 nuclease [Pleionea litopenaei]|uniref:S1/P1 nuclease n=1 Tax=Pleionea litopenaei TaxID=3070815 RepID=A0AA51RRY5_9GAMM|nr:S1/P1 nuclease [Pleionea sp. HL-JVS1]WMS86399.1 S1/P1 nuclease [Pleionea sp. HL-JVS1]
MSRGLVFLIAGFISVNAFSFGQTGHRVTGAIAEEYLNDSAKKAIQSIIGTESLAQASTFADEMKSNPSEFWQKTANPYHYVTVPRGKVYAQTTPPQKGDAIIALKKFTQTLQSNTSTTEEKAIALKFIVHIIGDLHQPLHAGNGTDKGGNDFKVKFFWQDSNLHRVWDSELIDRQQLSYTEWTAWLTRTIDNKKITQWSQIDPQVWVTESAKIRDTIYPDDPKLSWDYQYQHLPALKQRLQQAGVRIALYLNDIYSDK